MIFFCLNSSWYFQTLSEYNLIHLSMNTQIHFTITAVKFLKKTNTILSKQCLEIGTFAFYKKNNYKNQYEYPLAGNK